MTSLRLGLGKLTWRAYPYSTCVRVCVGDMADVADLPVKLGQEYRVKLGKSFTFPKENAYHTIKCEFSHSQKIVTCTYNNIMTSSVQMMSYIYIQLRSCHSLVINCHYCGTRTDSRKYTCSCCSEHEGSIHLPPPLELHDVNTAFILRRSDK